VYALPKSKKKLSSRNQINIDGARDGVLMLPNHHYRVVLKVSPINFEVKSEVEQDAMIDTYESFLNSLSTPLQILVRIREIDMDNYLANLNERLDGEQVPVYRQQLENYNEFIQGLITTNKILTRQFYVVIPFNGSKSVDFETVREQLSQTSDLVQKGLSRLGMQSSELDSQEILELFYNFYNEAQAKLQPLTEQALALIHSGYIEREKL
jgi:hypothetical protein